MAKPEQNKKSNRFPFGELAFALVVIGILVFVLFQAPATPITPKASKVPRFASQAELVAAFQKAGGSRSYGLGEMATGIAGIAPMAAKSTAMDSSGAQSAGTAAGATSDYSKTNVQVEGVDEADIVKSDGKYIYNFSNNRLIITDAYPIEGAQIISRTDLNGLGPQEMFVLGSKLLIFGTSYNGPYYGGGPMPMKVMAGGMGIRQTPPYYGGSSTVVRVYDISNPGAPVAQKDIEFTGSYLASRLIGSNAYFVVNSYPRFVYTSSGAIDQNQSIIPFMTEDGAEKRIASVQEIGYLPPMPAESFVTIASLNLDSLELNKETIAGSAQSVFASAGNIYLGATVWKPQSQVPVVKDAEKAVIGDSESTVVNKFSVAGGKISFIGQGSVPGHILNQFSMDEFNGKFRIATTVEQYFGGTSTASNNVYVLDEQMKALGRIEGIAPNETIYAVRFMNERGYVVTFNRIDPLFVIDLSDPSMPKVLGELKIPGYSDYLQPYDSTHLIGIGKDVDAGIDADKVHTPGAVYYTAVKGLKMSLFDVSDVANPKEISKYVIGERGTDSEALYEHKALLFDRGKQLLVLPVSLHEIPAGTPTNSPEYFPQTFDGAYVFSLNLESGFQLRGKINHMGENSNPSPDYYYGGHGNSIRRSLYIGNVLYTLSESKLKANDLTTLQGLKEFDFVDKMAKGEAVSIAQASSCVSGGGSLTGQGDFYNDNSRAWWLGLEVSHQEGCSPACVVSEGTRSAEINWRCTGLIPQ